MHVIYPKVLRLHETGGRITIDSNDPNIKSDVSLFLWLARLNRWRPVQFGVSVKNLYVINH